MRIISATVGPLPAAAANSIVTAAGGTAGTPLTLTTTPYVQSFPGRIIITSTQTETGITFKVVGTDWNGSSASETISGVSATPVQSVYDYATIISITPSSNTSGNITVGTNGVASTRPIFLDEWAFAPTAIQVDVSGTANATVQQSLDDPNASAGYTAVHWVNHPDSNLVSLTSTVQGNYAYLPKVVRLLVNSGATGTDYAKILVSQSGAVPF